MTKLKPPVAAEPPKRPDEALPGRRLLVRLNAAVALAALVGLAGPASSHEAAGRPAMLIFPVSEAVSASGREAIKARIAVIARSYCSENAFGRNLSSCRREVADQLLKGVDQSVEAHLAARARVAFADR